MDHLVMACTVIAHVVMVHIGTAYTVMVYIVIVVKQQAVAS